MADCHFLTAVIACASQFSLCFCFDNIIQKFILCCYFQQKIEMLKYTLEHLIFMYDSYAKRYPINRVKEDSL
jgi:hypothetical protein